MWNDPGRILKHGSVITLFFCLLTVLPVSNVSASPSRDLKELVRRGKRIKIEGMQRGANVYEADEVQLKGETAENTYEVEGTIGSINLSGGRIMISDIIFATGERTTVVDANGGESFLSTLETGTRVKIEVGEADGLSFEARKITVIDSRDHDVEIKGPIEDIFIFGRYRMDIIIMGKRFICDESTEFFDPDDEEVDLDYSEIDVYRRLVDSDGQRPPSRIGLGEWLIVGGEVQLDIVPENNLDLTEDFDDEILFSKLSTRIELTSRPRSDIDVFFKLAARKPLSEYDPLHPNRSEGEVLVGEAYILFRQLFVPFLGLKVGRQDFDEAREWLYDENLDAVRFYLNFDPLLLELSTSTNFSEDKERDEDVVNYILYGSYEFRKNITLASYIIHREDDDQLIDHDRRWYGVRSLGEIGRYVEYWADLSFLRGERRGRELHSYAFDIGFTATMKKVTWKPSLTLGFAYGSGDADYSDNVDGNFRQTDFEDNNDRYGGVTSFRYYGEALEPELSNMRIYTAGAGLRLTRRSSLDLFYHRYRQVVIDNDIHGSNLLSESDELGKDLGSEIDVVLGFEKWNNFDFEFTVGIFDPGDAFEPNSPRATRTKIQVEYNF